MSKPNQPTLIFPNGGEDVLTRVIRVQWEEPSPPSTDGLPVWYEVYYSEFYDNMDEPDWKKIATLPSGNFRFDWKVGNSIRSNQVKVGVLSVNIAGERSNMSVSANTFSIQRAMPISPVVLSPIPNNRYGSSVEIAFDDTALIGTSKQRAKYYVFFHSISVDIPFSPIAQGVPVGSGPLMWDTSDLPPARDYVVTAFLLDDDGNKSPEVNIQNLSIINEGYFLLDTKPPSGFVQINNGDEFTNSRDVAVNLFAFDDVTGIHSMRFVEGEGDNILQGPPEAFANVKYHTLAEAEDEEEQEGTKTLKALFQDFAGNRTNEILKTFRIGFQRENRDIADTILDETANPSILWVGVNGNDPALYKIEDGFGSSFIGRINEKINVLGMLTGVVYIGVQTSDSTALVYRRTSAGIDAVINLEEEETEVLAMETFDNNLYLGTVGGSLYSYDESSVVLVKRFDNAIDRMYASDSLLYILLRNDPKIVIYDGTEFRKIGLD